jgi:hypothetical protein
LSSYSNFLPDLHRAEDFASDRKVQPSSLRNSTTARDAVPPTVNMSMYPHRGMPQNARLNELLDQVRSEFENQMRVNEGYDQQS